MTENIYISLRIHKDVSRRIRCLTFIPAEEVEKKDNNLLEKKLNWQHCYQLSVGQEWWRWSSTVAAPWARDNNVVVVLVVAVVVMRQPFDPQNKANVAKYMCACVFRAVSHILCVCIGVSTIMSSQRCRRHELIFQKGLQSPPAYKSEFTQWDLNTQVLSTAIYRWSCQNSIQILSSVARTQ